MSISNKDKQFMQQVAAYFRTTIDKNNPDGSIRDTAAHFGLSRNKIRKILITTGDITSSVTKKAQKLRSQGMTTEKIAEQLGISNATVSVNLPYEDVIRGSLDPGPHAEAVRGYRAYQKDQAARQVQNKEAGEKTDASNNDEWLQESYLPKPSADKYTRQPQATLSDINAIRQIPRIADKEAAKTEALKPNKQTANSTNRRSKKQQKYPGECSTPFTPEPRHLHMELVTYDTTGEIETILKKYGGVKYGSTISRDVLVPYDIPLYAIHYLIQRLFGWQNSHLHKFKLPEQKLLDITGNNVDTWAQLVGIIFRSPYMDEADLFWADDYKSGSFKNWLSKKYTGPYQSKCRGENFIPCQYDMTPIFKQLVNKREYYVIWVKYGDDDEQFVGMTPVRDENGKKLPPPTADWIKDGEKRVEKVKLPKAQLDWLPLSIACTDLLERLPLDSLMTPAPKRLTGRKLLNKMAPCIYGILTEYFDYTDVQVYPRAFTDTIYYEYDTGDGWEVKITIMDDCRDLLKTGRITRKQLDKAQIKCRDSYCPVTLAVDGEMLLDDVGGVYGFLEFLKTINPELTGMSAAERKAAKAERKEMLEWAKIQGWKEFSPMI